MHFSDTGNNSITLKGTFKSLELPGGGGHSNGKRGYQARPWTHKKHPNRVLFRYGKKKPKYMFLHAFFFACSFQNLSI